MSAPRARPAGRGAGTAAARRGFLRGAALAAVSLAGCAFDHDIDHAAGDAPGERALAGPVRVAWVFGSGGPRGFVHVGVLKALDELGLAPDLIVGASVGALVGTLRAAGLRASAIEALALELSPLAMARIAVGATERLSGRPLAELIETQLDGRPLERLAVPMACVATRLPERSVVAFTAGNAGIAVQASSAIEGQFAPVRVRGNLHVDPDLQQPLPVRQARRLGALRVLAVDASAHEERAPENARRYRDIDLRKRALIRPDAEAADLLLHPDFGYWVSLSRSFREHAIAIGYRDTMARAGELRRLHAA